MKAITSLKQKFYIDDQLEKLKSNEFVENAIDLTNIKVSLVVSFTTSFVLVALLIESFFNHSLDLKHLSIYRITTILYLIACAVVYWYSSRFIEDSLSSRTALTKLIVSFITISIVFGLVQLVFDLRGTISYLTILVWVYGFFVLHPEQSFTGITVSLIGYGIATYYTNDLTLFDVSELIFFWLALSFIAYLRYASVVEGALLQQKNFEMNQELEELTFDLAIQADIDALTQLMNRTALKRKTSDYIGNDIVVMLGDIDDFKQYNDRYGHDVGDLVLQRVANILVESYGKQSVYRFGGDEFLIVSTLNVDVFARQTTLCSKALKEIKIDGMEIIPSGSFGYVYGTCKDLDTFQKMIFAADELLYEAKKNGKDCMVFKPFEE